MQTYQPNGRKLVQLNSTVDGQGMVATHQSDRKMLVALGVNDNGGLVVVSNKTGEGIAQMSADEYGNGVVGTFNPKAKGVRFNLGHDGATLAVASNVR